MLVTFSKLGKLGRLGNSMFQIAATLGYAAKHNRKPIFPFWTYGQEFQIPVYQNDLYFLCHPKIPIYNEPSFSYSEIPPFKEEIIDLVGYFQSEKYFAEFKTEIVDQFRFSFNTKHPVLQYNTALQDVASEGRLVSVHIRRGDYLDIQDYHPVLSLDYYEEAFALITAVARRNDLIYLVFSDDVAHAKLLFGKRPNFMVVSGTMDITDAYLMTLCNYHVIANSSFSWWGAYLSNSKMVVSPGGASHAWFGPKGPIGTEDLIPAGWVKI